MATAKIAHGWEAQRPEDEGRLRWILLLSVSGHLILVLALSLSPRVQPIALPPAISIDLLEVLPNAPAPKSAPSLPPAPPPRVKKPRILPKRAPAVAPNPRPEPVIRRRARPPKLSYDEALARLQNQVGQDLEPLVAPSAGVKEAAPSAPSRDRVAVAPELAAWRLAVKRHMASFWIAPPEFRKSGLVAEMVVHVAADGTLMGRPELVASSGNPYYDDNALRALRRASPLPPPPTAGRRTLIFSPEDD